MAKNEGGDIIYINDKYRPFIDELKSKDILGFKLLDNKNSFLLAVALGLKSPTECKKKRFGWTRKSYIKTVDKALWSSVLLGTASTDEEINKYADLNMCIDKCEECAETGFGILQELYEKADGDAEVFERRIIKKLDLLYIENVENDI